MQSICNKPIGQIGMIVEYEGLGEVAVIIRGRPLDALCVRGSVRLHSPG
jgi:hypothetical protein